jgi:hypothetical protein
MTDTTTPSLEDLRAQFEAADALCKQISAEEPRGELLFAEDHRLFDGKRLFSPEQSARLDQARARRMQITMQLHRERTRLRSEAGAL